jgi:hypothetical protein
MQWGDLSFQSDTIGDYVSSKDSLFKFLNLRRIPIKITDRKRSVNFDSRFSKIKTLAQIYAREQTQDALN